jgi:uncharacterized membrane protein YhaH (DUF805 family)
MTFVDSIKTCLSKYADFKGRASRSEYWWFYLFLVLVYIVLMVLVQVTGSTLLFIPVLALFLPSIAAGARRLHDTNRSGWWLLIGIIPLIGLALIVLLVLEATPGDNQYGPPTTS